MSKDSPASTGSRPCVETAKNWALLFFAVGLALAFLLWRRWTQISSNQAHRHLAEGALVVDIRTPEEF